MRFRGKEYARKTRLWRAGHANTGTENRFPTGRSGRRGVARRMVAAFRGTIRSCILA